MQLVTPLRKKRLSSYKRILLAPKMTIRQTVRLLSGMSENDLNDYRTLLKMNKKNPENGN